MKVTISEWEVQGPKHVILTVWDENDVSLGLIWEKDFISILDVSQSMDYQNAQDGFDIDPELLKPLTFECDH